MVGLGTIFVGVSILTFLFRNCLPRLRWTLLIYVLMIPLPYLALELGGGVTEGGRQPWVVNVLLHTSVAVSHIAWYQVAGSLAVMGGVYTALTALGIFLMGRAALKDPEGYPSEKAGE